MTERTDETQKAQQATSRLKPGDFFELRGVCYEVTKLSHKGTVFCKPYHGRLLMPKATATAVQLQGARRG